MLCSLFLHISLSYVRVLLLAVKDILIFAFLQTSSVANDGSNGDLTCGSVMSFNVTLIHLLFGWPSHLAFLQHLSAIFDAIACLSFAGNSSSAISSSKPCSYTKMFGIHVQQTAYTAMMLSHAWMTCFCGELYFNVSNSIFPPMLSFRHLMLLYYSAYCEQVRP